MTLQTDLYALMQPVIGGTVIFADQSAARPALPYTTLKVMSVRRVNTDHYSDTNDAGEQEVKGDREFTLSVQRFQAYGPDSVTDLLQIVSDKLRLTSVIDKFWAKRLVAFDTGAVTDISALLDKTQIEKRAALDIMIRYKSSLLDQVGYFDTVHVTGTDDGVNSPEYVIVASV